jgi:MinD-like ATPase involved in chromosome partitioning or flagellar assembly
MAFYSLRGGVGRSTALAHTANLLAQEGRKVVCVDMDLEAPGLAALFGVEDEIQEKQGLVYSLIDYDMGFEPDLAKQLVQVDGDGNLFLIPAGRPNAAYAQALGQIDPQIWYEEAYSNGPQSNPLRAFFSGVREHLPFKPDIILVDLRTGINTISAPVLFEQADLAVVVFYPHPQARVGTGELVGALSTATTIRQIGGGHSQDAHFSPEIRFLVSPLPPGEAGEAHANRAHAWIDQWLGDEIDEIEAGEITHTVTYSEETAVADVVRRSSKKTEVYGPIADWARRFIPTKLEAVVAKKMPTFKEDALRDLHFDSGTVEHQETNSFLNNFIETEVVERALDASVPLVLGRKGTGKTAVFRYMLEEPKQGVLPIPVHPPQGVGNSGWHLSEDGFHLVESRLVNGKLIGWKHFWLAYILTAVIQNDGSRGVDLPEMLLPLAADLSNESDMLNSLAKAAEGGSAELGIEVRKILEQIDSKERPIVLLFDGLDVGFGNDNDARRRRRDALIGLFSAVLDLDGRLKGTIFKVLLREDIWRQLRFENKSHLYGRSVVLRWGHQSEFLKVVLKQALRASSVREVIREAVPGDAKWLESEVEAWGEDQVRTSWNVLAGERMAGGKTAFTRNWVWRRLGDANDDHAPRHLIALFDIALMQERDEQKKNRYDRSIIRPRTLSESLPEVSNRALESLKEEFQELDDLINVLRHQSTTPVDAKEIEGLGSDKVNLGLEVGLLGIHEGTTDSVIRYRVPELYRWALDMGRKGPA